jgi:hypothetical protein
MPLFEVETENHIVITWAEDGDAASAVVGDAYPQEHVMRLTKRPRDTWVISKSRTWHRREDGLCHWHVIACRKPKETRCTRFGSTCTRQRRLGNAQGDRVQHGLCGKSERDSTTACHSCRDHRGSSGCVINTCEFRSVMEGAGGVQGSLPTRGVPGRPLAGR